MAGRRKANEGGNKDFRFCKNKDQQNRSDTLVMLTLISDAPNHFKKIPYGKEGEKVKLIATYGNILIVENKEGNRYPVKKEKVKYE